MIEAGEQAPDFTLQNQDDEPVSLADHKGHKVVLYFYPKADTPGCTTQACGIRDRSGEYDAAGATVIGVSADEPKKLRKFADKHDLDFALVGDPSHDVLEAYGVWVEKKNYGKTYMGIQRSTFIIDEGGKVAHVIPKASPKTHDDQVLAALAEL
jgi:peroxiredoxin Q/BCP